MVDVETGAEPVKPVKTGFKLGFFSYVTLGLVFGLLLNAFVIETYVIPSQSMENTLHVKDYMVSVPLLDNRNPPERGTVVVFNPPSSWGQPENTVFVKRVIGVAGDTVECCSVDGKILVNGQPVNEPYLKDGVNDTKLAFSYTVPTGQVFVMGDNRLQSADSRYHPQDPFIPVSSILGQPSFIIWPLNHVGSLN